MNVISTLGRSSAWLGFDSSHLDALVATAAERIRLTILTRREAIEDLFGESDALTALLDDWLANGVDAGRIERIADIALPNRLAAYAAGTDTIYLAEGMLHRGLSDEALIGVLVEEIGHRIDARVNPIDTAGDEGSAFAALVRGEPAVSVGRDDSGYVTLADGTLVPVEQVVSISDSGGYEGSFQTITLEGTQGGTITYYYEHYGIPDRFIIRYEGRTLFDTGFVGGSRSGTIELPAGQSDQLTIIVATDNQGTAWNYSVSVESDDCPDVEPWIFTALGDDFEHNDQTDLCETTGSIAIGRSDGATRLLTAQGSTSAAYGKQQLEVKGATLFSAIGGISESLFSADFTVNLNTGIAALSNVKAGDFKLAGLAVEFKSMAILSDTLAFDVRFTLPNAASGLLIDTVDFFDDALRITSRGAEPILGFKIDPPGTKSFKLLDFIEVEASKMSLEYRGGEDALRFQAKVVFNNTSFADTKKGLSKIEADLSGDNYVQVNSDGQVDLVGVLKLEGELEFAGGWSLKGLEFNVNTTTREVGGSATLGTPFGLKFGEGAEAKAGVEFIYDPFALDKLSLSVDNLNKPIPAYPAFFFQSIGGGLDNFATANSKDLEASFLIGATLGPQIGGTRLARAQFDAKITPKLFEGKITTDILTAKLEFNGKDLGVFTFIKDESTATLDWSKGELKLVGTSNILDGFFVTTGTFTANSKFEFGFSRIAQMSIPNFVPGWGGTKIANSNLAVAFSDDNDSTNDYVAGWGQYTISTPWDTYNLTLGLRIDFTGDVTLIGAGNIPKIGSWMINAGTEFFVVTATWDNADPDAKLFVTKPDGTIIQEADFEANQIMVIEELSTPTSRTVVIGNPVEGIWDVELVDETGKGNVNYEASGQTELSELTLGTPTVDGDGQVTVDFDAAVVGNGNGTITFFYDDDLTELDGIVAGTATVGDGAGSFTWDAANAVPGDYFLYAYLDDKAGPIIIAQTTGKVSAGSQADVEATMTAVTTEVLPGDIVRYTVTATNLSATTATGVTALVNLPDAATFLTASITAGSSDFADYGFALGDIAGNSSKSFTIDIRVPASTPVGTTMAADVYMLTDNYDPETGNDMAGFQFIVDTSPDGVVDLVVDSALDTVVDLVAGEDFEYTVTITNNGTADAVGVVLTEQIDNIDNLAADRAATGIFGGAEVAIGTIAAGASVTVTFYATALGAGSIRATSTVTSDSFDGSITDNETLTVIEALGPPAPQPDVSLTMTASEPDSANDDQVTLRIDLNNAGPGVASGIQVKIDLPDGVELLSQSALQGFYDATTEIWTVGNMRDNLTRSITLVVKGDLGTEAVTAEVVALFETDTDSTPNDGTGDDFVTLDVDFGGAPARPNRVPLAADDTATTVRGQAVAIDVTANDIDRDGDTLRVELVGDAANGTTAIGRDGRIVYTPDAGFEGSDRFFYLVNDGFGGQALAYVDVTVTAPAVNVAPVAGADTATTTRGTAIVIDVLANDSDPNGDTLSVGTLGSAANGTVTLGTDGRVTYTPADGFVGEDSFTYTLLDGRGGTATGTVRVNVAAVNRAPVAGSDSAATTAATAVTIDVLANDSDADGDTLTIGSLGQAANGTLSLTDDGQVVYTPDAGFAGTDSFTYVATDAAGATATGTVTVTISPPVNRAPVAADDITATGENRAVVIDVLANDSDADGDTLTVSAVGQALMGSVVAQADGTIVYTPGLGTAGTDRFTYTVTDAAGLTSTATVEIEVTPRAPLPTDAGEVLFAMPDGAEITIIGSGTVFGGAGYQHVTVADVAGTVAFDPSFNGGGDLIELAGAASGYDVRRVGSSIELSDGDTVILLPLGERGTVLRFADGDRIAVIEAGGTLRIGDQAITTDAAPVTATGAALADPGTVDPAAVTTVSVVGDSVGFAGNVLLFGTAESDVVRIGAGSTVELDGSFNLGNDVIIIADTAQGFTATRSGSAARVTDGETTLTIPLGMDAIELAFSDGVRELGLEADGTLFFRAMAPAAAPLALLDPGLIAIAA